MDAAEFDPGPFAVPVGYRESETGEEVRGTGFLGRANGEVAFFTAAHNVYGKNPVATPGWDGWSTKIGVYPQLEPGAAATGLEAFNLNDGGATPRFSWNVDTFAPEFMIDVVRFDPAQMRAALHELEDHFEVVDLENANHNLSAGDALTCAGFPRMGLPETYWPFPAPERCGGPFWRSKQGFIQAKFKAISGFSGGPVFGSDGRFVGVQVGGDSEVPHPYMVARIVTAQNVLALTSKPIHEGSS